MRSSALRGGVIVTFVSAIAFGFLLLRVMERQYDYYFHVDMAKSIAETQTIGVPHPLLHILAAVTHVVTRLSYWNAMLAVVLLSLIATTVTVYVVLLRQTAAEPDAGRIPTLVFLSLTMMIVSSPAVFAPIDRHLYFGYLNPNTFHNPTVLLLKALSLPLFLTALRAFEEVHNGWRWTALAATLTVLSALAKPNYILCIVPAMIVIASVRLTIRQPVDTKFLALGVVFPGVAILAIQYYVAYITARPQPGGVMFAPFAVFGHWSEYLLPKFLLSILFPFAVYFSHWRLAKRSVRLNGAWIVFLFGAAFAYFFAESGERMTHGNFWWGAQVALFILFVESAAFCLRTDDPLSRSDFGDPRHLAVWPLAFGAHMGAGIIWYAVHLMRKFYF